jgi:hypothetical protein
MTRAANFVSRYQIPGMLKTSLWINDAGEVVGWADLPYSDVRHAFL